MSTVDISLNSPLISQEKRDLYASQRAERGFSDYDLENFDDYLLTIIADGLAEIARRKDYDAPSYMDDTQWREFLTRLAARFRKAQNQKDDLDTLDDAQINLDSAFKYLSAHLLELWN